MNAGLVKASISIVQVTRYSADKLISLPLPNGPSRLNPDTAGRKVAAAFSKFPNWQRSEAELREVRRLVTFAVYSEEEDMEKVTSTVESLFTLLQKSFRS